MSKRIECGKILSGRTKDQNIGWPAGDITADCVAKAFGVPIDSDPRALGAGAPRSSRRRSSSLIRAGWCVDDRSPRSQPAALPCRPRRDMLHDAIARRRVWRGRAYCLARRADYVLIPVLTLCITLVAF